MMRVLGRVTSINVRKVLWGLGELGLAYERDDWGLPLRDPNVPEFLALNPNGQVPVLLDGDFVLWESNAILNYLADKDGSGHLLPADPQLRARAQQWLGWQSSELGPSWSYAVQAMIRKTPGYDDPARIGDAMTKWTGKMEILEGHLEQGEAFVAGDQFTIADIALGLSVHRWFSMPLERKAFPVVGDYYERLKQRPEGARWMTTQTP
ncbi:glutathione S-transferase [Devosia epidermidihirudinis]|uniref:Glutathione S-transferase n=1 Tax=Devosia epidermidihirudinis TaxID=1293439 RepID=A0A0F5QIR7_9HYPH|nr:glutathione S-transferase family protein [Devosia epidermidihirudinis]KKC40892.1 glutathione S-transferase [Devosia epidermidihirudinis]